MSALALGRAGRAAVVCAVALVGMLAMMAPQAGAITLPNDTYLDGDQNHKWDTGEFGQTYPNMHYLKSTNAYKAWKKSEGAGVTVAVIGTGLDINHPDIDANVYANPGESGGGKETNGVDDDNDGLVDDVHGWDFVNHDNDPEDVFGFGTAVSGVVAAEKNNAEGIAGIAPQAKILPIKVSQNGEQNSGTIQQAFDWLSAHTDKFDIVLSGVSTTTAGQGIDQFLLRDVVCNAWVNNVVAHGKFWINAAGEGANTSDPPMDINIQTNNHAPWSVPAACKNSITVGGVTARSKGPIRPRSPFSNFGANLHLVAPAGNGTISNPGVAPYPDFDILTLKPSTGVSPLLPDTTDPTGRYFRWKGTGMAAAQVAGATALMLSLNPNVVDAGDVDENDPYPDYAFRARDLLEKTARRVEKGARPNATTGWGELDVYKALSKASKL